MSILDAIKRRLNASELKWSTSAVSDALDSRGIKGCLTGIRAQVPQARCIGEVWTVEYRAVESSAVFKNAANYIDDVPPGSIIVSSSGGRTDATVWGDILTDFAVQQRIAGTVIDGVARDIDAIREVAYPLFSRGVTMTSGKNRLQLKAVQSSITISGVSVTPGDIAVADGAGCVIVPREIAADIFERAHNIEQTEAKIRGAIRHGMSLKEARAKYRYDRPWEHAST